MQVKIKQPTSLSDIKLSQYQRFLKATEGSEDVVYVNKQLVSIYCNIPFDLVDKISKVDFDDLVVSIANLFDTEHRLKKTITHNGVKYGFIPNLDSITLGEQIDIDTLIRDWHKMGMAMAVLYRPITMERKGKYLIEDYGKDLDPLDLTMDVVFGAMVFFYNLMKDCMNYIQSSIKAEASQTKVSQHLEKSGVGISQFTESLEATFLILKEQLSYDYTKPYSFYHLKQKRTDLKVN